MTGAPTAESDERGCIYRVAGASRLAVSGSPSPDVFPDEDVLDGHLFGPLNRCFGCSPGHPHGMRLRFRRLGDAVRTSYVPTDAEQGPLGVMHGGLVSTFADEVAAWAVILRTGRFGFTTTFSGRFRSPIRVSEPIVGTGRVVSENRRLLKVEVTVEQGERLCFTSTFGFALLTEAQAEELMGRPIPEEWKRFARPGGIGRSL